MSADKLAIPLCQKMKFYYKMCMLVATFSKKTFLHAHRFAQLQKIIRKSLNKVKFLPNKQKSLFYTNMLVIPNNY